MTWSRPAHAGRPSLPPPRRRGAPRATGRGEAAMTNFYADLTFFAKVLAAACLFRLAARPAPLWVRQVFLIGLSAYFLSTLAPPGRLWLPLGVYLLAVLAFGQVIAAAPGRAKSSLLGAACIVSVTVL